MELYKMPQIPAYCENCDIVFGSGLNVKHSATIIGSKTKCPRCQKLIMIQDGLYQTLGNITHIFPFGLNTNKLERLLEILQFAKTRKSEPEAVSNAIKAEAPELKHFADCLPKNKTQLYAFIVIIIMIIQTILSTGKDKKLEEKETTKIVNEIVNQIIIQEPTKIEFTPEPNIPNKKQRIE